MDRRFLWLAAGAAAIVAALILRQVGSREANKAVDRNIDAIIADLPQGYTAHYAGTETNPLTGTVTLREITVNYQGKILCNADSLTLAGAGQDGLHTVFDPAAYPGGHPASARSYALLETIAASNLRIADALVPDNKISVGSLNVSGLSGRQFFEPPTPGNTRTREFAADAALALAARSIELHDVTGSKNGTTLHIGTAQLRDFARGKFSRASLENTVVDTNRPQAKTPRVHVDMGKIEARGYDLTPFLTAARDHTPAVSRVKSPDNTTTSMNADNLALTIPEGPAFTIGQCQGGSEPPDFSGLKKGKFACRNIVLDMRDTRLDPTAQAAMDAFGMHAVTLDINAQAATDTFANHMKVDEDIDLHDLSHMHLRAGAAFRMAADGTIVSQAAMAGLLVDHADLVWTDRSFTNRVFAAAAARMHTTPETLRAQLAIPLISLGFLVPDQPDIVDQITGFLNNPNTLTVTLTPPQPFTLAEIGRAPTDQKARLMGLRVKAN